MKVPEYFVGKFVGIHLARPVYLFELGGSVIGADSKQHVAVPILKYDPQPPGAPRGKAIGAETSDMITGAKVVAVDDDSVTVDLFVLDEGPGKESGVIIRKCIPSALVMSIDAVDQVSVPAPITEQRPQSRVEVVAQPKIII